MSRPTLASRIRNPRVIVPTLLLLLGIFGAWWFLQNFERKSYEQYQGESPAARKNPFLAAERYLQAVGKEATSQKGMEVFSNLPPTGDAIVLPHVPSGMGKNLNDRLFSWIEAGGQLLLVPARSSSNHPGADDILKRIGVQLQKNSSDDCGCPSKKKKKNAEAKTGPVSDADEEKTSESTISKNAEESEDNEYHPYNTFLDLDVDGFPIHLRYYNSTLLDDVSKSASFRIDGSYRMEYEEEADHKRKSHNKVVKQDGAWLLQYNIGTGRITVMSEMWLFKNWSLGDYDHAFFLSWLVRDADRVWLLYNTGSDPLGAILWDRMPYFWLSLAALIILTIWSMQKRIGNLLRPQFDSRRNILAHIDATGIYSWRIGKGSTMIAENRKTILRRLAERQLGLQQGLEGEDINISTLAAKTGATEHDLLMAFRSSVVNEQDLIRTSRALQEIEKLIQGGGHDR